MVRLSRATTATLVVCLLGQTTSLFAADEPQTLPARVTTRTTLTLNGAPLSALHAFDLTTPASSFDASTYAQFRGRGRSRGRGGRNDGAAAALFLGAIGTIAGSALLIYANRPECSVSANNSGCGYGTKVAGGAVLTAGLAGLTIGAITWR
jgi:hypothetical protein